MNFNERHYYVCPVCGRDFSSVESYPSCDFCNNHEVISYPGGEWKEIRVKVSKMSPLEFQENLKLEPVNKFYIDLYAGDKKKQNEEKEWAVCEELFHKKYVYNNPFFDKAKFDMRAEWEYEKAVEMEEGYRKRQEEKNKPRCPKCGCTEFQMVPRKWSPLTGFLTNKVDRVCVKCKTRY